MSRALVLDAGGSCTAWAVVEGGALRDRVRRTPGPGGALAPFEASSLVAALRDARGEHRGEALVIGAAGAGSAEGRTEVLRRVRALGFQGPVCIMPDGYGPLAAARGDGLLILCGTGSLVLARAGDGVTRGGGRGPALGDPGSGRELGALGLRRLADELDAGGPRSQAGVALAAAVRDWRGHGRGQLEDDADLGGVVTAMAASGAGGASLAPRVLALTADDPELAEAVRASFARLARCAAAVAGRAGLGPEVEVLGFGGVMASEVAQGFLAAELAGVGLALSRVVGLEEALVGLATCAAEGRPDRQVLRVAAVGEVPPTEVPHPRTADLDQLDEGQLVDRLLTEFETLGGALRERRAVLVQLVRAGHAALSRGGRIVYVGAGTSGRLGVLDASESPPTFRVAADRVVGVIAGGPEAVFRSMEGAEDSPEDGARAMRDLEVGGADLVVGVAASGSTPFVGGALRAARTSGARTALVTAAPGAPLAREADLLVDVCSGPEVLTGSTRMAAGTAAKVVLNLLTTCAWVRSGKAYGNFMVDLVQACAKLEGRARRIMQSLLPGADEAEAERLLAAAEGSVKLAVLMGRRGLEAEAAREALQAAGDSLREALERA